MVLTSLGVEDAGVGVGNVGLHEVSGVPHHLPAGGEDRDRPVSEGRTRTKKKSEHQIHTNLYTINLFHLKKRDSTQTLISPKNNHENFKEHAPLQRFVLATRQV